MAPGSPWLLDVDKEIGSEEVLNVVEADDELEELEDPFDFFFYIFLPWENQRENPWENNFSFPYET